MIRSPASSLGGSVHEDPREPVEIRGFATWAFENRHLWAPRCAPRCEVTDIVGEVLLRLLASGSMPKATDRAARLGYLKTSARRVAIDAKRRCDRRPESPFDHGDDDGRSQEPAALASCSVGAYSFASSRPADGLLLLPDEFMGVVLATYQSAPPAVRKGILDLVGLLPPTSGLPLSEDVRTRRHRARECLRSAFSAFVPGSFDQPGRRARVQRANPGGGGSPPPGTSLRPDRNAA